MTGASSNMTDASRGDNARKRRRGQLQPIFVMKLVEINSIELTVILSSVEGRVGHVVGMRTSLSCKMYLQMYCIFAWFAPNRPHY